MAWNEGNIGKEEYEIFCECMECHEEVMYDVEDGLRDCDGYFMNVVCAKCGHVALIPDKDMNREYYIYKEED